MTRRRKVGELAQATGLTVRTLHHWDDKGLVTPSQRSASGHRLYTEADIERADPGDPRVAALAERWMTLLDEFDGGRRAVDAGGPVGHRQAAPSRARWGHGGR